MVTYQFDVDDDLWDEWKNTVPRSKNLDERLRELLRADRDGRVQAESAPEPGREPDPSTKQEATQDATAVPETSPDSGADDGDPNKASDVEAKGDSLRADALEAVAGADIPGRSTETREARTEALLWAWEYLRAQGRAQSSEIANATFDAFDEDDLGYSAQKKYRGRGLWQGYLRDELRELPRVDGPGERGRTWEFVEDANTFQK